MEKIHVEIEALIDKFLNAETTNAEEKRLYDFFVNNDVSDHLLPYKKEFMMYHRFLNNHSEDVILQDVKKNQTLFIRKLVVTAFIAAGLIGVIFLTINLKYHNSETNTFDGSYIAHGSFFVTDLDIIQSQLEMDLMKIVERENEIDEILYKVQEIDDLFLGIK